MAKTFDEEIEWWWRTKDFSTLFPEFKGEGAEFARTIFDADYAISARTYELHRRKYGPENPRYPQLSENDRLSLARKWPGAGLSYEETTICVNNAPSGFVKLPYRWFNVAADDATLISAFKQFLQQERSRLGIQPRTNKGLRNRGISWRPVESYDLKFHCMERLGQSANSQLNKLLKTIPTSIF